MKRWEILYNHDQKSSDITHDSIISILLKNRGITGQKSIEEFLHPQLESVTFKSVGIERKQVTKALKRINKAIDAQKTIVVYGDYDVDGICATAIMWEALYSQYKKARPYIPHRTDEGYGISQKGIDNLLQQYDDIDVIITVDNGIVAYDAITYAKSKGIDVVITDHHVSEAKTPESYATVHTTKLCGTGIAYLFAKELLGEQYIQGEFLDLVALATVADLVPLTNDNRVLLYHGLEYLNSTDRLGLRELFHEAGIAPPSIGVYQIGHIIAPRLNATGRLDSALDSLRLVCTKDGERAKALAQKLAQSNKARQDLTKELSTHALHVSQKYTDRRIIVVAHETYNQGVVGLMASKLVEYHYKPSLVLSVGDTYAKGSARSIKGVNIIEMIRSVSEFVIQAGGHPMAAGFTVDATKIDQFREALELRAQDVVQDEHLQRIITIDMKLDWQVISTKFYNILQTLAPFGMANYEPVFMTESVEVCDVRTIGKDRSHYKLLLEKEGKRLEAVAFNMVDQYKLAISNTIDVVYTIDFDTWNGKNKVALKIKDLRVLS